MRWWWKLIGSAPSSFLMLLLRFFFFSLQFWLKKTFSRWDLAMKVCGVEWWPRVFTLTLASPCYSVQACGHFSGHMDTRSPKEHGMKSGEAMLVPCGRIGGRTAPWLWYAAAWLPVEAMWVHGAHMALLKSHGSHTDARVRSIFIVRCLVVLKSLQM